MLPSGDMKNKPHWKTEWVRQFRDEFRLRVGFDWTEGDAEAFWYGYGSTPHGAVMDYINAYDLNDITKELRQTVYYVVLDMSDEEPYLREGDPGEDFVCHVGTDKFRAEQELCKICEGME